MIYYELKIFCCVTVKKEEKVERKIKNDTTKFRKIYIS